MSMTTHITGIVPGDEKFQKMRAIYDMCIDQDVDVPKEVEEFFNWEEPDESGVVIDLRDVAKEWSDESSEGYEIDVDKIPKDVKTIRFYNNW